MAPPARVPGAVSLQFPNSDRATHLDYSPTTHPRQLNASQDAQRIIDALVNNGAGGIPERVAFDGGFRLGKDRHYHSADVVEALRLTSQHYVNLSQREAGAGNTQLSQEYRDYAVAIARAQVTYVATSRAYWNGSQVTPPDVVNRQGEGGERLIGENGRPLPAPRRAVNDR